MTDKDRLDAIQNELLILHPPAPTGDKFDGLWVVCDYALPNLADYLSMDKDLRKAIDGAMWMYTD